MPKILLVEDDELISDMYKIKFEQAGYDIFVCPSGEKALDAAKNYKPELILLDLVLPKVDGYEVLKRLKNDPETSRIKIYILSNLMQNGEVSQGFESGADGYLIKSDLTPKQLADSVRRILAGEEVGLKKPEIKSKKTNNKKINGTSALPDVSKGKILLIEDEDLIIEMYKFRLEQEGYEVITAKNGAWGLKLAKENRYDVILMDMVMPAMKGVESLKLLKAEGESKNSPVIVFSNSAQDKEIKEAQALGAVAYLIKSSTTPVKMIQEIKKIIAL